MASQDIALPRVNARASTPEKKGAPSRVNLRRKQLTDKAAGVVITAGGIAIRLPADTTAPARGTSVVARGKLAAPYGQLEVRPIKDMTTNRHFCEVFFTDVRVPVANLVGAEGGAFKQTMRQLEHERGGIDRLVSNYALYQMALEKADTSNPVVRDEIAALEIAYRIGRVLVIRETLEQAPAGFSAATKCFCTEHEVRVSDFIARVLGPEATLWDDVTRGLSYAPGYTIMGGTSNVMRNILGERVLGLPKTR